MKTCPVGTRLTAVICVALVCLPFFRHYHVRGVTAHPRQLHSSLPSDAESAETNTCDNSSLEFTANVTQRIFQFKCAANSKLHPVEEPAQLAKNLTEEQLGAVYEFTPAERSGNTCGTEKRQLGTLVHGSTLTVVDEEGKAAAQQEAVSEPKFRLSLGPAPDVDRYLCYTCTTPGAKTAGCNIYVTVPGKDPEVEGGSGTESEQRPGTDSDQRPDTKPDSGSASLSVPNWLTTSVAAYAMGLMLCQ